MGGGGHSILTHSIYIYELSFVDKFVYKDGKRKHLLCVKGYFESYNYRCNTTRQHMKLTDIIF